MNDLKLHRKVRWILSFLDDPDNLAGMSTKLMSQKVQYKKRHKDMKQKNMKIPPPIEFEVTEMKIDLEIAVKEGDFETQRKLYSQLIRIING